MKHFALSLALAACLAVPGTVSAQSGETVDLTDAQVEELVHRSYQYVAMFNVNQKFALDPDNPQTTGGYNRLSVNTSLTDHNMRVIARPNNDTMYSGAMIDVTEEPVILKMPAFDTTYASLMVTGYDHYVAVPVTTRNGDFAEQTNILFYSERTPDYEGQVVDGVDMIVETTGDFVSAVLRVMPHMTEPERLKTNVAAMESLDVQTLSAFLGQDGATEARDLAEDTARFPAYGTDLEIFEYRFVEVMQFVVNHSTFDVHDELDAVVLAVLEPLGIVPGKTYDPKTATLIDGQALRAVAERVANESLALFGNAEWLTENVTQLFLPKGQMTLERQVVQSVGGPIGLPGVEALYPTVATEDGAPMNAMHDYEFVMSAAELPPVNAFWSATLYETETGFFIPNDQFKYSVGENAGFTLDADGGIRIVIAAEHPEGVPEENWLPINREDMDLDIIMRLYAPDLERYESWTAPIARKLN